MKWLTNTLDGMRKDGVPAYGIVAFLVAGMFVLGFVFGVFK